ncbi:MAG: 8-oxo-dGTP diphosphatase MutT [Saccharospirillum sp.]
MTQPPKKHTLVAVGMVLNGDRVLIAKRPDHLHQGGLWEFPGGKVEPEETVPQALARELKEEVDLDTDPHRMTPLTRLDFDYGDKAVSLDTWIVPEHAGKPWGREAQRVEWVAVANLDNYSFPAANVELIKALKAYLT